MPHHIIIMTMPAPATAISPSKTSASAVPLNGSHALPPCGSLSPVCAMKLSPHCACLHAAPFATKATRVTIARAPGIMEEMVLLGRIELPTSSLPMTRSTTELQQQLDACGTSGPHGRRGLWLHHPALSRTGLPSLAARVYQVMMSEKKQGGSDAARAERLAEQLRANLRKRKVQARGVAGDSADRHPREGGDPSPGGASPTSK